MSPKTSPKMSPKTSPKMKVSSTRTKPVLKDDGLLKPMSGHQRNAVNALMLTKIPLSCMRATSEASTGRPQRTRMRPIESWRNERVVYSRELGSNAPSVVAVQLNLSGRPQDRGTDRDLSIPALQAPPPVQKKGEPLNVEFDGLSTQTWSSKMMTLPLKKGAPYAVCLKGSGVLHMLEGSLQYQSKHGKAGTLSKGDSMALRGEQLLVAPPARTITDRRLAGSIGARFWWIEVSGKKKKAASAAPVPIAAS